MTELAVFVGLSGYLYFVLASTKQLVVEL